MEIDPTINTVVADSEKTARILTNFLSGTVRYSYEDASIQIRVEKIESAIRFSVTDNGQGIEPKYLDKIFERYFRVLRSNGGRLG